MFQRDIWISQQLVGQEVSEHLHPQYHLKVFTPLHDSTFCYVTILLKLIWVFFQVPLMTKWKQILEHVLLICKSSWIPFMHSHSGLMLTHRWQWSQPPVLLGVSAICLWTLSPPFFSADPLTISPGCDWATWGHSDWLWVIVVLGDESSSDFQSTLEQVFLKILSTFGCCRLTLLAD